MLDHVFMQTAGRLPAGAVETSSYTLIRKLLTRSALVSFRSAPEFDTEAQSGHIVPLDLGFSLPQRSICCLQRAVRG